MEKLKCVPSEEIYHVSCVDSVDSINWDDVAKAKMTPRAEQTLTPPNCYGQLVVAKEYGLVARMYSDDNNPVALCGEMDGAVCNDSALEFFLQLDNTGYLNFETNYKGVNHQKFGNGRENRTPVTNYVEERFAIKTQKLDQGWEAIIYMPFYKLKAIYPSLNQDDLRQGFVFRGNFYTMTSQENDTKYYYCQWVDTKTAEPDYHVPDKFGYFVID